MREDAQAAAPMTGMARKPAESGRGGHRGLALGLILLAQLLVVIDVSIVTLALPGIQRALGFSPVGLQWVTQRLCAGVRRVLAAGRAPGGPAGPGAGSWSSGPRRSPPARWPAGWPPAGFAGRGPRGRGPGRGDDGPGGAVADPGDVPRGPGAQQGAGRVRGGQRGWRRDRRAGLRDADHLAVLAVDLLRQPPGRGADRGGARPLLPESRAGLGHRRSTWPGRSPSPAACRYWCTRWSRRPAMAGPRRPRPALLACAAALLAAFVVIEARSAAPLLPLSFFRNRPPPR